MAVKAEVGGDYYIANMGVVDSLAALASITAYTWYPEVADRPTCKGDLYALFWN